MKKRSIVKMALAAGMTAMCMWGLVGCSSDAAEGSNGLTGGVAATVNGVEIAEDDVTLSIESVRTSYGITDEASWASWMQSFGYTSETVRSEVIDGLVEQELVRQGAAAAGIVIDATEIDSYVDSMKGQFDSEEAWVSALQGAGFESEEKYRETIELSLMVQRFEDTFESDEEPSDESILEYAGLYRTSFDGAKRSSHILFDASDEATAQEVLAKLNSGELDFAEAAAEYSLDGSGANGGDVGWDALSSFVTEYQAGLDELEKGEISGLVTSQYGIHIIMCTDHYVAPEEITDVETLPTEFYDVLYDMAYEQLCQEAYQTWLTEQLETSEIVINDMPEGLSYYVDMEAYAAEQEALNAEAEAEGQDGETSDADAESDEEAAAE
ncbi:MAG: peptidylprolyl isomerase [Eggerthellaceae bacterium]|nr:peptidylprolyl isomerase [Eggerthellaceae bacterium]